MQYIVRNNLYNPTFTLTNCDGSNVDLSTSTVKFILKSNKTDSDSSALLVGEYVNSDTNIVQFEFDANETRNLPVGRCIGALKRYRADNKNEEVWSEEYTVTEGVFND